MRCLEKSGWGGRQARVGQGEYSARWLTMERKSYRICYTNIVPTNTLNSPHPQQPSNSEGRGRPWVERRKRGVSLLGNSLVCSTSMCPFLPGPLSAEGSSQLPFLFHVVPPWLSWYSSDLLVASCLPPLCIFTRSNDKKYFSSLYPTAPPWVPCSGAQGGSFPLAGLFSLGTSLFGVHLCTLTSVW